MLRKCTRFVEYEHLPSGRVDNMPEHDWVDIQRNAFRRKEFQYIRTIDVTKQRPEVPAGKVPLPVEEDPLECPLCGYVAEDEKDLQKHRIEVHT